MLSTSTTTTTTTTKLLAKFLGVSREFVIRRFQQLVVVRSISCLWSVQRSARYFDRWDDAIVSDGNRWIGPDPFRPSFRLDYASPAAGIYAAEPEYPLEISFPFRSQIAVSLTLPTTGSNQHR